MVITLKYLFDFFESFNKAYYNFIPQTWTDFERSDILHVKSRISLLKQINLSKISP